MKCPADVAASATRRGLDEMQTELQTTALGLTITGNGALMCRRVACQLAIIDQLGTAVATSARERKFADSYNK